ncbi:UNVERIFIED_CONTAM: hypothetical protein FKN15_062078, partial [Acipenser sinensis]
IQKEDGRQRLRELLKWKKFDEERDLRPGIFLDFVYESVVFAVKKGFPWHSVAQVIKISQELLNDSKDLSVAKAVELLRNKLSKCETQLAQNHQLDFLDFLMGTFIRHHGLYQFVMRGEREVDCTVTELQVHTPPNPLPLSEGTDSQVWQYQQRMATLTGDENQKRINMLLLKETAYREAEERLDMLYKDFAVQDTGTLKRQGDQGEREATSQMTEDALSIAASWGEDSFPTKMEEGEEPALSAKTEPSSEVTSEASLPPLSSSTLALGGHAATVLQFPWTAVAVAIHLTVAKAVELLRNKLSKCETQLAQNHQLDFLDFLMGTFIRHHGLYQFVMRGEREVDCTVTELQVHTPPNPLPLSEGTDSQVWQYQQRMATLTGDENQKRINMLLLKETAYREAEERLDMLYKDFAVQDTGTLKRQLFSPGCQREATPQMTEDALSIAASWGEDSFPTKMEEGEEPALSAKMEPSSEVTSEASLFPLSSSTSALGGHAATVLQFPWTAVAVAICLVDPLSCGEGFYSRYFLAFAPS